MGDHGDPPELSVRIPQTRDLPKKTHKFSENFVVDFLLLTFVELEFLSCFRYLQEPLKFHDKKTGFVYVGKMGEESEQEKLTIGLMKCDMGSGVGGSTVTVQNAVTTLKPKGVFCVGFCGGINATKAKLGDVVVSAKLSSYASRKVTDGGIEPRGMIVPLSKKLNDIMKHAEDGWDPPLKNMKGAEPRVVLGGMLSGPMLVNSKNERDRLLKYYPDAIAIEMEGEGVFTAAYNLQTEWVVVKGISDYADGTKDSTNDWKPYASVMAASLVAHVLSQPSIFRDWPHYYRDSLVPQEIQAQGQRAEEAFRKAMEKGSVEVYRGRIMLIGQDRAGKTSLKKFLLGIPFDPEEKSTVGIEVDPTKFEVENDQVKNWQFTDHKKLDLSEYREDIAKITAENMKALEGESQETTDSMDLEQGLNVLPKIKQSESNQGSKAEIDPSTSNVQQNDMRADQDDQLKFDTTAGITLDDVAEKVEKCLQGLELNDDVKAKEVILSVWDFAGQYLYYASHSVFLSYRAVYVLVHNLSKDLSAQAKPYAKHETRKIELENPNNQTNLDNLLSWLVSVHCIRPTTDEASDVWEEKEEKSPPYLRPPVFVVGTHADKPFKDISDTLQCIQDNFSGKEYDQHVIRPLYAVDNTRSDSYRGVQDLQNRISEVLKQEPYMGEKVPIRWFHFEKVVEALVANEIHHMELNELLKYTKRFCHIDKEDELEIMLKFYHDLGVIVKHGRTVVLQALWLIDLFKQLINVRPYDERDPRYSGCWQELKEKGILRMDLVEHVFTDIIQKDISKQDILKMMEDHGLIAKFSFLPADGDHQQEYFVPSLLKSLPIGLYEIKLSNCDPCPLYLHFLDGFVPHGLFAQLVSRCIVWCSGCCREIPELYQNGAMFFFIGKQHIFDLVLICRKRFIKIILTQNPQASAPSTTYSARKASEVRVFLEGTLKDMREQLRWLRNLRYELCVACTHCLRSPDQCGRHGCVRCADDDCLSLLPLRPEEQLICRKNFAREPIKISGLEKWLLLHEKESEERKMVSGNPKGLPDQSSAGPSNKRRKDSGSPDQSSAGPSNKRRKDSVKVGRVSEEDMDELAYRLGDMWIKLGNRLKVNDAVLSFLHRKDNLYPDFLAKAREMLRKWESSVGDSATYQIAADLHSKICSKDNRRIKLPMK